MDLSTYQTLTGTTVDDSTLYTAQINRTQKILESLLGYTLDSDSVNTNFYNELGRTQLECACPIVDTDELLDPDDVVTAYRTYKYDPRDKYWHVDPFTKINAVKLVYIKQGASPNGVTIKTFDDIEIREDRGRDIWSKYIEWHPTTLGFNCYHDHFVQLAVDADWEFSTVPEDLQYVWADMVTYYADKNRDVKSESILTHSYTRFDNKKNGESVKPEMLSANMAIITRYAGPHGTAGKMVT